MASKKSEERLTENSESTDQQSYTVIYNDLKAEKEIKETFEDVDRILSVGNPNGLGSAIIVNHNKDVANTVREGVELTAVL